MKNSEELRKNCLVLSGIPTFIQNLGAFLNIIQYITLAELSQLYCETFKERREELRPLLNQIAIDFNSWLEFFNRNRFKYSFKAIRPMIISEMILSAKTFGQKQKLYNLNLEERNRILDSMETDAQNWDELLFLLTALAEQGKFNKKAYKKALRLAGKNKERLLSLLGLRTLNNYRRAYLCRRLLETKNIKKALSGQNLVTIYRRLDKKSKIRPRVLAALKKQKENFNFWLFIYQSEQHETELKEVSLKKIAKIEISPEKIIHTGNDNCTDGALVSLMAKKLEKIEINPIYWENLYNLTTPNAPEIREIILEKKRLAISLDDKRQDPPVETFTALRDLYVRSNYNPKISEKILVDIININPEQSSQRFVWLNFIKNSLNKLTMDQRSLKKMIFYLAKKIKTHEEWIDLSIHCKISPILHKLIIKEYKQFFIRDFLSQSPSPGIINFRNREIKRVWVTRMQVA